MKNDLRRDLIEESTSDFRAQLLATTIATARRARRTRVAAKTSAAFAILILAGLISFPHHRQPKFITRSLPPSASSAVTQTAIPVYTVIHTEPFTAVLRTTPLPPENLAALTSNIKFLDTARDPAITPISDDQLLALFAGQPVALVAGPRGEELIFLEIDAPISN